MFTPSVIRLIGLQHPQHCRRCPVCWEASMSKTKVSPLLEFLFLVPGILNRMVRVSFVEMVRSEQREEEGEGKGELQGVFRRRAQLEKGCLPLAGISDRRRVWEGGGEAKMVGRRESIDGLVGHWENWLFIQGKCGVMMGREVTDSHRITPVTARTTDWRSKTRPRERRVRTVL